MYRDFSDTSKQNLLDAVTQINAESSELETNLNSFSNYDFSRLPQIDPITFRKYIGDVREYRRVVLEKNNATVDAICRIFDEVYAIDVRFSHRIKQLVDSIIQWESYLKALLEYISPSNGLSDSSGIKEKLNSLLIEAIEQNASMYYEYDSETGTYTYDWELIDELLSRNADELTDVDYLTLTYVTNTMVDTKSGNINTEALEKLITLGYTDPSPVTSDDYHTSFQYNRWLPNENNQDVYYYLQNKSYLSETFLTFICIYDQTLPHNGSSYDNVGTIFENVVEHFSIIEWRTRVNVKTKTTWSTNETYVPEDILKEFNESCAPKIDIEFCNDQNDSSGLDYYSVSSNSFNNGVVTTSVVDNGRFIRKNDPVEDGYTNSTIRIYFDCSSNKNADNLSNTLAQDAELSTYYKQFDEEEFIEKKILDFAFGLIPFDDEVGTVIDVLKDSGDYYSEKNEIEKNNRKVDVSKDVLHQFNNKLSSYNNLGVKYDTIVVEYNHCEYNQPMGYGPYDITVDNSKECSKPSSITHTDFYYDRELLAEQYESSLNNLECKKYGITPRATASEEELQKELDILEKEVLTYLDTGKVESGSLLEAYMKTW